MTRVVDLLIVTAVEEEYQAVLHVDTGAVPGSAWTKVQADSPLEVQAREFRAADGGILKVAVTRALRKGGEQAILAALALAGTWDVRCVSMCGVCAGREGKVELGDVIIADRLWRYDSGKRTKDGEKVERFDADTITYNLRADWHQKAERFVPDDAHVWLSTRPRTIDAQMAWVLDRMLDGHSPSTHPDASVHAAQWPTVIRRLWEEGLVEDGEMTLTETGRKRANRSRIQYPSGLPEPKPFAIHVAPLATGNDVVRDPHVYDRLTGHMCDVLGLEMEASALGALGHVHEFDVLVMKAVMDFANTAKNDQFKAFAATASAEVLIAFARQHITPKGSGEDPILDPGTSDLPKAPPPTALLNARYQVVPFHGRAEVLSELEKWCGSEDQKTRARLLFAPGGMGKTRFAIELCRRIRERGWRAGFLRAGQRLDSLLESDEPALAVIDYAESRAGLRDLLAQVATRKGPNALRVLLLARNHDDWWSDVQRASGAVKDLLCDEPPLRLEQVAVDRKVVFQEALAAYLKQRNRQSPLGTTTPNLSDPSYERVLYVHAAALAAAVGREVKVEALMKETLDHEERFWGQQLEERGHAAGRAAQETMRLAVAGLTLRGGGSKLEARELVGGDAPMIVLLRDLYPSHVGKYISGLEPDLLGEAMVVRALTDPGTEAGLLLDRVFKDASSEVLRTGFTVLGRISEHHDEARDWIARVLASDVKGRAMDAFAAARAVGERTAHSALGLELAQALQREGTIELADELADLLPSVNDTVSLLEVGLWVHQVQLVSEGWDRASQLDRLSCWQDATGHREAALASAVESVALFDAAAASAPDRIASVERLASARHNLAIMQIGFARWRDALATIRLALRDWGEVADAKGIGALVVEVADLLGLLSGVQTNLGEIDEASAAAEQAVAVYRDLVDANPAFQRDLAIALENLGNVRASVGETDAAVLATGEAAELYARLAERQPEAFLPKLAKSLGNLAATHYRAGNLPEALAFAQKAIVLERKFAAKRPEAFNPTLAISLNTLACINLSLGHLHEALDAAHAAIALAGSVPSERAKWRNTLGRIQAQLGQHEDALLSAQQALDDLWPSYVDCPDAFGADAHEYLTNVHNHQTALGRPASDEFQKRCATFNANHPAAAKN